MKFTADCKAFSDALSQIRRTCGNVEYVSLKVGKKAVTLSATNKTNIHNVRVGGVEIEETGEVALPLAQLDGVLRNRKQLMFSMDKHAVFFESLEGRKYSGEITPLPYEEHEISIEGDSTLAFDAEQVKALDDTLAVTKLNAAYDTQDLALHIRMDKDGLLAVCGDHYHSSYIHNRSVAFKDSHTMSVLSETFNLISGAAKGKPYTLAITSSSLTAYNSSFKLQVPFLQSENGDDMFSLIYGLVEKVEADEEGTRCTVQRSDFKAICDNASAFYSQNVPLNIQVTKKGLSMSIATTQGRAAEQIAATDVVNPRKEPIKLELSILDEFINLLPIEELPIATSGAGELVCMRVDHQDMDRIYICGTL